MNFSEYVSKYVSFVLDTLLPPRKTELLVRNLSLETLSECRFAQHSPPSSAGHAGEHSAILPYHHEDAAALVWELKYYANKKAQTLAGALLKDALLEIAAEEVGRPILIPIPMHAKRKKERGHNQTELLCASALAHMPQGGFDYAPEALVRTKVTHTQQGLTKARRLTNVKNTMALNSNAAAAALRDRVCVIVDDVATTGATFAEARRALKSARPRRIYCVALAGNE